MFETKHLYTSTFIMHEMANKELAEEILRMERVKRAREILEELQYGKEG